MATEITDKAQTERKILCKHLDGKALLKGALGVYAAVHCELRNSIQSEDAKPDTSKGGASRTPQMNRFNKNEQMPQYSQLRKIVSGFNTELLCPLKKPNGRKRKQG
jgi:hypothetical protein